MSVTFNVTALFERYWSAGDSCTECANTTLPVNALVTVDYDIQTRDATCEPVFSIVNDPPAWASGGPSITCVDNCSTEHVFGGSVVVNPLDFMVSLQIPAGSHRCGGTLIIPGYVLTAAHCVLGDAGNGNRGFQWAVDDACPSGSCASALVGAQNRLAGLRGGPSLGQKQGRLGIAGWAAHPLYDPVTFAHDVALVRLSGSMDWTRREYALGPWNNASSRVPQLSALGVLGWGLDETGNLSPLLRNATMPYVPRRDCLTTWTRRVAGGAGLVTEDTFCAGSPYATDSCSGDSGGPIVLMGGAEGASFGSQVGIVSHGVNSCGGNSAPGVYASLADPGNAGWIVQRLTAWGGVSAEGAAVPGDHAPETNFVVFLPLIIAVLNFFVAFLLRRRGY